MLIRVASPAGVLQEWALIELQGKFESQVPGIDEHSLESLGALVATHKVGDLRLSLC